MKFRAPIIVTTAFALAVALIAAIAFDMPPRLVWNGSKSAPLGLYRIEFREARVGDFVYVEPAEDMRTLIRARGYLPQDTPLIKRVAALSGDDICREETHIFINSAVVATALLEDSTGRKMPEWSGCISLEEGEIFLLNEHPKSLDGRYFGATNARDVIGVAKPFWTSGTGE